MITEATLSDYPRLGEIWESAVRATHDFLQEEDILFYRSRLTEYFDHVDLYVYKNDRTEISGFLGVENRKIEMLFIDSRARGRGIGKALLRYAVDELKATLVDVNEHNQQAVGFYLHSGFRICGRSPVDGEGRPYPLLHLTL